MTLIDFSQLCFMTPRKNCTILAIKTSGFAFLFNYIAVINIKIYELLTLITVLEWYPHSNNTRSWKPWKRIIPVGLLWGNTVVFLVTMEFEKKNFCYKQITAKLNFNQILEVAMIIDKYFNKFAVLVHPE